MMKNFFTPQGLLQRFLILDAGLTMSGYGAFAQFSNPILLEYSFPPQFQVGDICHNYSYKIGQEVLGEGYRMIASSITRIGAQSRVGLRWLDNTNNVISEHYINIGSSQGNVRDVEAAFLADMIMGDVFIFVTYYSFDGKFLYDLFRWDLTSDTIGSTGGPFLIQYAPDYGRISLVMVSAKEFAVCWENDGGLWALTGNCYDGSGGGFYIGSPKKIYVQGYEEGIAKLPDITFAYSNDPEMEGWNIVISFISNADNEPGNTGNVYVIKYPYNALNSSSSPVTFPTAINSGSDPVPAHFTWPVSNTDYYASSKMNIAGHLSGGSLEQWAVVYNEDDATEKDIMVIYNTGSTTTSGINLTDLSSVTSPALPPLNGDLNRFPTVTFDTSSHFTTVWYNKEEDQYIGYFYDPVSLPATYYRVSLQAPIHESPIPALSSLTLFEQNSFMCGYPVVSGNNEVMNYKFIKFINTFFRPGHDPDEPKHEAALQVSPNPFYSNINLSVPGDMQQDAWQISLRDITGRTCYSVDGNVNVLNQRLNNLSQLPSGLYFLQVQNHSKAQQFFFKLVKE